MSTLLHDVPAPSTIRRLARIPLGVVLGASLGVAARVWMRSISTDPEFTASGTGFIVGGFAVFGGAQAVARAGRASSRRWLTSIGRAIGAVGVLPLFVGAGAVMLPTVVAGGVVRHRPHRRRWVVGVLAVLAAGPIVMVSRDIVDDFGWSLRSIAGIVLLVAVYLLIVRVARPTFAPNPAGLPIPRWVVIVAALGLGAVMVLLTAGFVFTG